MQMRRRFASICIGTVFALLAYPTLMFLLWLNNQTIDCSAILGDGGLFFFATAVTSPIFFESLLEHKQPKGMLKVPFFVIPSILIILTMLVHTNIVVRGVLGASTAPIVTDRQVYVGIVCAVCAILYRSGFDPQWSINQV